MTKPNKNKNILDDELPLRGVLKCHCGQPLSVAPSRGKGENWYYCYKCKHSRHNNISAKKAHEQLLEIFHLMSLSGEQISIIKATAEKSLDKKFKENRLI